MVNLDGRVQRFLDRWFEYKEIGWAEVGEIFTRWTLFKRPWLNIYIHRMWAPRPHPHGCHDHPWSFIAIILWGGYYETMRGRTVWRGPGSLLFRPATSSHQTLTDRRPHWSIIIAGAKIRGWGFHPCKE
jgi:hypothetical protein